MCIHTTQKNTHKYVVSEFSQTEYQCNQHPEPKMEPKYHPRGAPLCLFSSSYYIPLRITTALTSKAIDVFCFLLYVN